MTALFWTPEALQDREDVYDYIEADKPGAALTLDALFEERAGCLLAQPGMGRPGRVAGTRELVVHQNYLLVYDVQDGWVRVLRVLHAARMWPR